MAIKYTELTADSKTDTRMPLVDMVFDLAVLQKWKAGQQKYGPIFQGNPFAQGYEEMLDAYNYVTVALQFGMITIDIAEDMHKRIKQLGMEFKVMFRSRMATNIPMPDPDKDKQVDVVAVSSTSMSRYGGSDGGE